MATIDSVKLPDNSTYDLTDNYSGYQTETLATPIDINGDTETTVEGALSGLNDYGDALADNLAANEENGAKQMLPYPFYDTTKTDSGITFTDNGNGTLTINGTASADAVFILYNAGSDYASRFAGKTILANISGGNAKTYFAGQADNQYFFYTNDEAQAAFPLSYNSYLGVYIIIENGAVITTPITISFMIRDARILDDAFAPFAKTNKQLTDDKAERNDLSTIHATGSTNTTGSTITAGTFFYLNGQFCKATADIAVNATFTLNTNYKVDSVGEELKKWTLVATATGDGVKTWSQVISEISSPYPATEPYKYLIVLNDVQCFHPMGRYSFALIDGADTSYGSAYIRAINMATGGFYEALGTLTFTNYATGVFPSGNTLKLYKTS